ncbi:MAG: TonB-dependent receptor [Bryobacterales bacterium]|nr:TonB-dependent receptor [Bryobacterales bacterium]
MTRLPLRLGLGPLAALSLLAGSVQARVISGSVSDPNGLPLSGATVQVVETGESTISDAQGLFSLAEAPDGDFTVRVISEDFEPVETTASAQTTALEVPVTQVKRNRASLEVVSSQEDLQTMIPGSLHMISKEELIASKPIDSNEVLRRVPGVNLREDSGPAAMRLNIGIRGLNPNRSRKVLMLEDGIPIALAPYGEPDMYYSPPIERMSRIEILKGSGQIAHGPQTVGGLVNFVTPEPPSKFHTELDLEGGQRGLFVGQASIGGSNQDQSFGWITSYLHKQGDGWRQFFYDIEDVQTKFSIRPNDRHAIALKAGLYDEVSNSTYLGLTTPMYEANPNQNPVSSDTLDVDRVSGALSHSYTISPRAVLSSTAFMYTTKRFWGRQDFDRSDQGRDYFGIAGDPNMQGGAIYLRKSAGNRNRLFNVFGAQSNFGLRHAYGHLDMGVRHIYEKAHDQRVNGDRFNARTGIIRDDEYRHGRALAGYIRNRFVIGSRVTVTPGVRLVHYNQERHITRKRVARVPTNVDIRKDNGITTAIPGLGFSVRAQDDVSFFAGVHRGFAPPGTKIAITSTGENLDLDAELSWNYEAGIRLAGQRAVSGEFTFFRMDFSNQVISAAESGGATTTVTNGGATLHQGFEASGRVHWNRIADVPGWSLYTDARLMYLPMARFVDNALFGGNRLPYAPRQTYGLVLAARKYGGLSFHLDLNAVGDQFGDNRETLEPSVDGTVGRLPAYQVANLSIGYEIRRERWMFEPYFTIKNAFDELYISSRAPQGIQPGLFRQVNGGLRISF